MKLILGIIVEKVISVVTSWVTAYLQRRAKRKALKAENQRRANEYKEAESEEDRSDTFNDVQ